jgi:hypothetical protein
MISQFSHNIFSSFYLWFEGQLVSSGSKAYSTNQSNSFEYVDFYDVPPSHYGYQGKFRQLVADHSVDVPNSGVFIDGSFVSGDSSDVYIDYNNGRVIVPQSSGSSLNITANNTVKEVNTYMTEDDEEQLLLTSDFIDSSDTSSTNLFSKTSKRDEKTYVLPACFLRIATTDNKRLALGGEDDTVTTIKVAVLAKDNYTIDAVLSFFADKKGTCIKRVPYENYPYGIFHDVKSFPYSYSDFSSSYDATSYIEEVKTSKVSESISAEKIEKNVLIGFIEFDLSTYRYPRL